MLADRPAAVAALTKIFLDEIERLLCAVVGGTRDADATARPRPRLGGISFLHRFDRDVPSYFQSLEHLFRYCARPPFALERLFVSRGADGQIARIRYVLPRHWATIWAVNWVGPSRGRKSTRPGANGVVELSPFEFLDRVADLVPPPRKHRHRYHGVFAPHTEPGPIRKILTHLGEPLEPPPLSPARGPPTDWGEIVQVHDDRAIFQGRIDELPVIDIHSL
ncbi:MAG: transposase [Planctomycetia bacterium]